MNKKIETRSTDNALGRRAKNGALEATTAMGATHAAMEAMPLTFAALLKQSLPRLDKRLRLPPWLRFILPYHRRDQACLSEAERARFLCALNTLNQNGTFGQLVDIHADMSHHMHGNPRFLPWHRIYLLQLEQALQAIHPDVTLPYWYWTKTSQQGIPGWLQSVTPTVVTPTRTINVIRSPGTSQDLELIASNTPSAMQANTFADFALQLEGIHNGVHVWVGGSMSMIATAPADPIFWMHHANIDRLWWEWQKSPKGQGKNPNLSGADAIMDPWSYTEPDTRDIIALGFTYD